MPLDILCSAFGINGGTIDCAPTPGIGKYLIKWEGKLTAAQLAQGIAVCIASLQADSKKSKNVSSKLVVFPLAHDFVLAKEANTVASLPDGTKQVTREGTPVYNMTILTDMFLIKELRKLNNKNTRYCIVDDKYQMLGTSNVDGDFIGRKGKFFTDGIDAHGFDTQDGQTTIQISAENASETYDNAQAIVLTKTPDQLFSALKDVQLYEKAAQASNVVKISGKIASPNPTVAIDMYADYSASTLGSNAALWKATVLASGASLTVTGVAPNSAGYFDVTLNSTPFAALSSGAKILLELVAPETLDADGVKGIEATGVIITKA